MAGLDRSTVDVQVVGACTGNLFSLPVCVTVAVGCPFRKFS